MDIEDTRKEDNEGTFFWKEHFVCSTPNCEKHGFIELSGEGGCCQSCNDNETRFCKEHFEEFKELVNGFKIFEGPVESLGELESTMKENQAEVARKRREAK